MEQKEPRIFNGVKFKGLTNLNQLPPILKTLQEKVEAEADKIWASMLISDACILYDLDYVNGDDNNVSYLALSSQKLEQDLMASLQQQTPSNLDLEVSLYVINHKDTKKSKAKSQIIGLHFIPNHQLRQAFTSSSFVQDFSFGPTKDSPNLTEKEWKSRKSVWGDVFEKYDNPQLCMFNYTLTKTGPREIPVSEASKFIPSLEKRCYNLAYHQMMLELKSTNITFNTREEFNAHTNSNEFLTEWKKREDELMDKLNSSLTLKDLQENNEEK